MRPDPERLADTGSDDFELNLLRAAERDVGSHSAQARCAAALTGALLSAHSATASAGVPLALQAVKWLGIGAGLGLAASSAAVAVNAVTEARPEPAVVAAPSANQRATRVTSEGPLRRPAESAEPEPSRAAEVSLEGRAQGASVRVAAPASRPPPLASSDAVSELAPSDAPAAVRALLLEREVQLLDSARRALAEQDPKLASAELDRHARDFPTGMLAPEALLLRVQTLTALGQTSSAEALARRFLATHPTGAHARRLERILSSKNP